MPGRLLLCLLALALLLPAAAPAAPVVGISEPNPTMFEDQSYLALRATTTRLLIAYDAVPAAERGDPELERRGRSAGCTTTQTSTASARPGPSSS